MSFPIGEWASPKVSGTRPPPCAAFSLTNIDDDHAIMFGGKYIDGRRSDVYIIIDLTRMVSTALQ